MKHHRVKVIQNHYMRSSNHRNKVIQILLKISSHHNLTSYLKINYYLKVIQLTTNKISLNQNNPMNTWRTLKPVHPSNQSKCTSFMDSDVGDLCTYPYPRYTEIHIII